MQKEPSQVAVKGFGIASSCEISVFKSPVGDGSADAVDDLTHAFFPLWGVGFAEKILAGNDIYGELAPKFGEFAVILFKKDGSAVAFDGSGSRRPLCGIEGIADIFGTESGVDAEAFGGRGVEGVGIQGGINLRTCHGVHGNWLVKVQKGPRDRTKEFIPHPCIFRSKGYI